MQHLIVRTRSAADLDRCVDALRVVHHAAAYPLNWPADPHQWLTPPRLLQAWIADGPDGAIAGHVAVQRTLNAPASQAPARHAELSRLYVTPAARRRSVASALVRDARSWAAEHGYDLTLNVTDEHRSAAVAFYEASGWQHSHTTDADWTTPDGRPVKLRHYILDSRDA
ncbi:GNAT family N-acetyltransferase [Micromonospora sp. NPDC047548]|uniref:GNAT family N-acetyltransferase n=1 Tax=Micromonospora sp. NPDC047548 TaxID=3155624 RepID=UPI0033C91C2E